jgi:hypothetical protein
MTNEYRIEPVGSLFIVVDPWGEIVNRCSTEEAARQGIERCKKEDAMYEGAKTLLDIAVKAHTCGCMALTARQQGTGLAAQWTWWTELGDVSCASVDCGA